MVCNFFAILDDNSVRKISLTQNVTTPIRNVFFNAGDSFLNEDTEEIEFDGNYILQEGEILYVELEIPTAVKEVETNAIGIQVLDLSTEEIKTLFWYENSVYYFQNFDKRKLLRNKNVILYSNQTYTKLEENAFIVEDNLNAIHRDGKFYFYSYANANKIFSLIEFYQEATNEKIKEFSEHKKILLDEQWFIENSNSIIRKHITLIQKSKILDNADTKKIKSKAKKFKLEIQLDGKGKIKFPNDKKLCKDILIFLNEQYYIGLISGNKFKTSSKRNA